MPARSGGMEDLLTIDEAARACSVSRDTIKRRLHKGQFPSSVRGESNGKRPPPWLIPVADLSAAGLRPVCAAPIGPRIDRDDPAVLREALARHEALAAAREAHLVDLRSEIRRLHERLDQMTAALSGRIRAPAGVDGQQPAAGPDAIPFREEPQ